MCTFSSSMARFFKSSPNIPAFSPGIEAGETAWLTRNGRAEVLSAVTRNRGPDIICAIRVYRAPHQCKNAFARVFHPRLGQAARVWRLAGGHERRPRCSEILANLHPVLVAAPGGPVRDRTGLTRANQCRHPLAGRRYRIAVPAVVRRSGNLLIASRRFLNQMPIRSLYQPRAR
jgi:hypothetical protein